MVVDFYLPAPGQSLMTAIQARDNKSSLATTDYSFHMAITWWGEKKYLMTCLKLLKRALTLLSTLWLTRVL